eukprot:scaffold91862_cov51-Cyclotella_meneghiniana.AAC.4
MSFIADVHVGKANDNWPVEERVQVHFHSFANLPHRKGTALTSSTFACAGHEWYLDLYPRGDRRASGGMISVYLCSELSSKINVDFDIIVRKNTSDNFTSASLLNKEFKHRDEGWGRGNYAKYDKILDASNNVLNNGTLTIEVRIRPQKDYCSCCVPKSSVADDLYRLYQDEDTADVAFKVEEHVYYAHKLILKTRVPELAELAEPYDMSNPIPIKDVDPEIFEIMLKHVYGKGISLEYWNEHAKQILDASGKYGLAQLKSEAEAWHVKNLRDTLSVRNVVDELLYADGKNCPLLKKAAMAYIVEHGEKVIDSESYGLLDESPELRKEVMRAAFSSKKRKREE